MVKKVKLLIVFLLVVIGFISASAQKVEVKSDPSVDLSKYKTYSWSKGMLTPNAIIHETIVEAVDRALRAKGLTKLETGGDFAVVAWPAIESDLHISHPSWYPGMNAISTGIAVGSSTWPVTKGTLVVDLADARTKNSVWRGTATDTLEHGPTGSTVKDAKSVEKKINKAVEKMFRKFARQ